MTHRQQHRVGRAPGRGDRFRVAEHRQQHRQRMRADVPQAALLAAPGRVGVRAGAVVGEDRAEPVGMRGEPATDRGLGGDPLPLLLPEARREEDHRGDARPVGGRGDGARLGHGGGHRLVQEEMAAGLGGADRQRGLHGRRQGDRDGVAGLEQLVGGLVRVGAVDLGQRGGRLRSAPPDAGELDAGVRGEGGGVDAPRPGSGAEKSDARGRHGASVSRGAGRGADFAPAAPRAEGRGPRGRPVALRARTSYGAAEASP